MSIRRLEVSAKQLRNACDPDKLGFETTDQVKPLYGTIGQERAVSAMELGLDIEAAGFNLFVAGPTGSGRNSALRRFLEQLAAKRPPPGDWGYVHNFKDPAQPMAVTLPCGLMRQFAHDMDDLVAGCRAEIPKAFESEDYSHRIDEVTREIGAKRQRITEQMEKEAVAEGFAITAGPASITPVPLRNGKPMTQEEFAGLSEQEQEEMKKRAETVQHIVGHALADLRRLQKDAAEQAKKVDAELVRFTLTPIIDELQSTYSEFPIIVDYLDQVESDMVEHIEMFKPAEEQPSQSPMQQLGQREEDISVKFKVNVLVDNTECKGAPVVFENNPTYYNLFGRIDYRARFGALATDLTMVKAGATHCANGGYLVLQARDLLTSPLSWESLKRILRSKEIRIENIGEQYSPLPSATLRPQAVPFNAKIIIVGGPDIMRMLEVYDEDFQRFFKVTADFDYVMERTPENIAKYASFIAEQSKAKNLKPFHKTAVAAVIDHSSRLVQHQEKLTTRFMDISDLLTEANYWASKDSAKAVTGDHVKKAVEQHRYRISLTEDRLQELFDDGTIHIATEGRTAGQVNGLAVMSDGNHTFGKPSRITARISLGKGQVVNVERETKLSGRIHDKGFMILQGYIQGKYGQDMPLSLTASIGFEQTYSEIDGDSASSTELYALLSELSGLGIDQGIAVTGSVNQAGEVQAIGGAIFKIEGFYDVCKAKGLTGKQGVMVPKDNLKNILPRDDVVEAVRKGKFHVWGVSTIDEGIEVLTGVPAGVHGNDGAYPKGTVHYLVEQRLLDMAKKARQFEKSLEDEKSEKKPKKSAKAKVKARRKGS
ncbi:MAG: ATP-dependent protease [SAR202 cluster bacterium]|nr:ATP-dependent protease [SAR202 cluster bacterium]